MMQARGMIRLTELDFCVLGVIWECGPVSAYGVRARFEESNTATWSSSAGSIYPSVRRLARAGLAAASSRKDERGTRHVEITAKGRERLRLWLVDLPPKIGTATADPIRTRAQFVTSVSPEDRLRFLDNARAITRAALSEVEKVTKLQSTGSDTILEYIGNLGSVFELRARLQWLDRVGRLVKDKRLTRRRPAGYKPVGLRRKRDLAKNG
jgi:DNA-binding PadR family transcriptional regulator